MYGVDNYPVLRETFVQKPLQGPPVILQIITNKWNDTMRKGLVAVPVVL